MCRTLPLPRSVLHFCTSKLYRRCCGSSSFKALLASSPPHVNRRMQTCMGLPWILIAARGLIYTDDPDLDGSVTRGHLGVVFKVHVW